VQKRKYEDDHGAEHGNFDIAEIREHEEFTKVKNIERIELGRFEMETWYFSPFPEEFKDCKVRSQFSRHRVILVLLNIEPYRLL
jgi:hypothetical protein